MGERLADEVAVVGERDADRSLGRLGPVRGDGGLDAHGTSLQRTGPAVK
jgi:hypothetical protein